MNLGIFVHEISTACVDELGSRLSPEAATALTESDTLAIGAAMEKAAARGLLRGAVETIDEATAAWQQRVEEVTGQRIELVWQPDLQGEVPDQWAEEYEP